MFKYILFFLTLFLVSSCFFWGWNDSEWTLKKDFSSKDFSIMLPSSWEIIENKDSILPKPANWEIVLAISSNTLRDNFYRNMLILSQEIKTDISSASFIKWNYTASIKDYFYKKLIDDKDFSIDDKDTKIYHFEARYSEDTPIVNFLQTWIVCWEKAFLITIALEKNNKNIYRYEDLLSTFSCINQE